MSETESPASVLRRAAALMRKRAEEATPGPWERPLDVRHKNIVGAALPDDEEPRHYQDGIIPERFGQYPGYANRYAGQRERVGVVQCNTWSDGTHSRKRNGRDLEYIASMHPGVALAVADWLEAEAERYDDLASTAYGTAGAAFVAGDFGGDVDPALKIARAYLGETPEVTG